jgi:hypothetical protein
VAREDPESAAVEPAELDEDEILSRRQVASLALALQAAEPRGHSRSSVIAEAHQPNAGTNIPVARKGLLRNGRYVRQARFATSRLLRHRRMFMAHLSPGGLWHF